MQSSSKDHLFYYNILQYYIKTKCHFMQIWSHKEQIYTNDWPHELYQIK